MKKGYRGLSRQTVLLITLVVVILVGMGILVLRLWRTPQEMSLVPSQALNSPLNPYGALSVRLPTMTHSESPLPLPATGTPVVNEATLQALRTTRPSATPAQPSGIHIPHISPNTWRRWALWIFAAAALLAYLGLRLRPDQ